MKLLFTTAVLWQKLILKCKELKIRRKYENWAIVNSWNTLQDKTFSSYFLEEGSEYVVLPIVFVTNSILENNSYHLETGN